MDNEAGVAGPPVSDRLLAPLQATAQLSDDVFSALLEQLGREAFFRSPGNARASVARVVSSWTKAQANQVLGFIIGFITVNTRNGTDPAVTIEPLVRAENLDLGDAERDALRVRLVKLLGTNSLILLAKAQEIEGDFASILTDSTLITDLRPVYGNVVADGPAGFMVWHSLKVTFGQASGKDDDMLSFMLDNHDLKQLQKQVTRALEKQASLEEMVQKMGLGVWNGLRSGDDGVS